MIAKINELKRQTNVPEVKSLCETTIAAMSSAIYNSVTPEAKFEIERVAIENLFEGLASHDSKEVNEWLANEKRIYSVKNIGIRKAINTLKESDAQHDQTLGVILENFEEKVNQVPEVLLYEEFVTAMSNGYTYLPDVANVVDGINEKVQKYKHDIDINKIIETMKATRSNYLLPLIEDVVNNYVANKTEQTKSHLKETLNKFSYDPFVRDIINIVMLDATDLQLEYANGQSEIEKVYSPIMYIGENEVAFNIKGSYYIKKGNNINKLKKAEVAHLDENFKSLCEGVNLPNVEIGKNDIKVYFKNDLAVINENEVVVNGTSMNEQEFKDSAEVSQWVGNTNFFMLTESLRANFNEITEIDFAKIVYLKEDEGHAAHVIKLRNNIFITTIDPVNNKSTFFRNINPIQAEKVMMEHMRFDVSKTFRDILPNKERILAQIKEAKQTYVEYIGTLNEKIDMFSRQGNSKATKDVLVALKEELKEVKSEYKDYVNETEKYTNVAEGVTVSIDVDGERYTVPIPQSTSTAKGEEADNDAGTIIGAENMEPSPEPASEITFDDSETELLGDAPSIQADEVDLGVDNVEAEADAAEAGAEEEGALDGEGDELDAEGGEEGAEELGDLGDGEAEAEGGTEGGDEDLGLGDEDLGLGDEEEEEPTEEGISKEYDEDEDVSEGGDEIIEPVADEGGEVDPFAGEEEGLEQADMGGEEEVAPVEPAETGEEAVVTGNPGEEAEVEDAEVKVKKPGAPKVFIKKKRATITESIKVKKNTDLNEAIQVGDDVTYKNQKGNVIGEFQGELIVQIQGDTHKVKPGELKLIGEKPEAQDVQYKFDKLTQQNLTTKTLFEQFVKCGIYMNRTPVKLDNCFVKFNEWHDAKSDDHVSLVVEGRIELMPKDQVRILEDINTFGNPENFVEGVLIDEYSGEALENVLINVIDYTQSVGDADEVRIVREVDGAQIMSYAPIAMLKTLSV